MKDDKYIKIVPHRDDIFKLISILREKAHSELMKYVKADSAIRKNDHRLEADNANILADEIHKQINSDDNKHPCKDLMDPQF